MAYDEAMSDQTGNLAAPINRKNLDRTVRAFRRMADGMRGRTREVMDMREPGESFCATCPDHEACMTGYPCSLVQRVAKCHELTCPQHGDQNGRAQDWSPPEGASPFRRRGGPVA